MLKKINKELLKKNNHGNVYVSIFRLCVHIAHTKELLVNSFSVCSFFFFSVSQELEKEEVQKTAKLTS